MKTIHILLGTSLLLLLLLLGGACMTSTQSAVKDLEPPRPTTPTPAQVAAAPSPSTDQHDHAAEDKIPRIKPAEAVRQVSEGKAILVDVRDSSSYETMHAKGALNVTFQNISEGKHEPLPKDKLLIFYCT